MKLKPKHYFLGMLGLIAIVAIAANPSFSDFNTNQFASTGNKVSFKSGALSTNDQAYGNFTLLGPTASPRFGSVIIPGDDGSLNHWDTIDLKVGTDGGAGAVTVARFGQPGSTNFGNFTTVGNLIVDAGHSLVVSNVAGGSVASVGSDHKVAAVTIGSGLTFDGTTLAASSTGPSTASASLGYVHSEALSVTPGSASPVGVQVSMTIANNGNTSATATTPPATLFSTSSANTHCGFLDSGSALPGVWQPNLTFNGHWVIAITNLTNTRTVFGLSSQISPSSGSNLSTLDAPGSGTNAVYIMASTNNVHWQLVSSDGTGNSSTTVSTVTVTTGLTTLDLVGNNGAGGYVAYVNGTPIATNTTRLPAGAALGMVTSGRVYTSGNYGLSLYSSVFWQPWQ